MQNETGPKRTHPIDITEYSRNDYTSYLGAYDQDDPDEYDYHMAKTALATHEATLASNQATALHNAQMQQLTSTTANVMTAGGTTNTAGSSGASSNGGVVIPNVDPFAADMKALKKAGISDYKAYALPQHDDAYSTWWKAFVNCKYGYSTCSLQGFEKKLNPLYVPSTPEEKRKSLIYVRDISTPFSPRFYLHLKVWISYVTISVILMRRRFSVNCRNIKLTLSLPHAVHVNVCNRS